MKTAKTVPAVAPSSRRAQPLRQTRNNPPRSSVAGSRAFGSRGPLGGALDSAPSPEQPIQIFPAIAHFADAITSLPKELVRHFTLLKEVDAKIFAPEEELGRLVDTALNTPPPRQQPGEPQNATSLATAGSASAQGSVNGSIINGQGGSVASLPDAVDPQNPIDPAWDPANVPRRQLFQHCAYTMQNMLVSLDEKNHVFSTAVEALNKQLARIDECYPYIDLEISEEARLGSLTHWAYPENRTSNKTTHGSRREIASVDNLSAAAQHVADEAAARSETRKQALLAKKGRHNHTESDFDDHDGRQKGEPGKKPHGNSKVRKAADAAVSVGLGITNGAGTNGHPAKRRRVDKTSGGTAMEKAMSTVFGNNATATKAKAGSPRDTPEPEGSKKKPRGVAAVNGQTRKRNTTVNSALSPSITSSPIRSTFPDIKSSARGSPAPANGGRPASIRARQNSTQSIVENARQPESTTTNKQNGVGTPDIGAAATVTGRSIPELKSTMKETGANAKGEHLLENADPKVPEVAGALLVGNRKESFMKQEEAAEPSGEPTSTPMQGIRSTTVTTTKSGRASKPSTPALGSFPEPTARSRSARSNALETSSNSNNKRSHKKGAGAAAAAQQLLAAQAQQQIQIQQNTNTIEGGRNSNIIQAAAAAADQDEEEDLEADADADEDRYCFCNGVSYGEMVACDGEGCEREWFHLECVGLKVAPKGDVKWYCDNCKERMKNKRFSGR